MPAHRKETVIRRNLPPQYLALPIEGRKGKTPAWPLPNLVLSAKEAKGLTPDAIAEVVRRLESDEKSLWTDVWKTPQAVMWERLGYNRIVARYVRHSLVVEGPDPPTRLLAEVRALEDRLGLTPKAMELLKWRIVEDEVDGARVEKLAGESRAASARERLKSVPTAVAE